MQHPNPAADPPATEQLIAEHRQAVWRLANRYADACRRSVVVGVDDLYSVGLWALLEAAARWRPGRGTRLLSWAWPAIRWAMLRALEGAAFVPRHARANGQSAAVVPQPGEWWEGLVWPARAADACPGFDRLCRLAAVHCSPAQARRRRLILVALYVRGERPCDLARRLGIDRRSLEQQTRRIERALRRRLVAAATHGRTG